MGESQLFLGKAAESLASADADFAAGRFNSCANRAYYAGFQAAIACLIHSGVISGDQSWSHRFVISEVSGTLIRRRKLLPTRFRGTLDVLLRNRLVADYQTGSVNRKAARTGLQDSKSFVNSVREVLEG